MHVILFDIDGTLIQSGGAGRLALARAFEKANNWKNALDGITLHGKTDPAIVEWVYLQRRHSPPTSAETARIYGLYLGELADTLEEAEGFRVLPGVGRLLARLSVREDAMTGLATGNIERGAREKLRRARLNHRFAFGGFGSDAKERSDIIRAGVERARERMPGGVEPFLWVVGDTPADVQAGKAAGVRTVAVSTGGADAETLRETRPDVLLADLGDAEAFLAMLDSAAERASPAGAS